MSGPVSSAVASEIVSRITTLLTGKCSEHKNVNEWIDRLVMARIEIKSAIKESEALKEEFDIDIDEELHEWQEKLKEALCEADEALCKFPAKILIEEPNQTIEEGLSSYDQSMQEEGSDDATLSHPASNMRETVTHYVNFEANLLHDQSVHEEGSDDANLVHPATNIGVTVAHQVNQANLPHDQSVREGSDEETLVHPASNFREAITGQVDLEANIPHDPLIQEEGFDDTTLVHFLSKLREALNHQVDLEANLPNDQSMQEERSDDATLVHPASNISEAVSHQVNLEANLPHDQSMHEKGFDFETVVHSSSNLMEVFYGHVDLEANLPHDQSMPEEGSDDATLVHPASNIREAVTHQVNLEANLPYDHGLENWPIPSQLGRVNSESDGTGPSQLGKSDGTGPSQLGIGRDRDRADFGRFFRFRFHGQKSNSDSEFQNHAYAQSVYKRSFHMMWKRIVDRYRARPWPSPWPSPWPTIIERLYAFSRLLDPRTFSLLDPRMMTVKYLENDEKVSKLLKTVEKLEKMAGNIGNFIKLLELQKKRKMNRKRKRSGVALQGFFLVLSLKLQTCALLGYRADPYLLVTMLFGANCTVPTAITGDIFIGFIM